MAPLSPAAELFQALVSFLRVSLLVLLIVTPIITVMELLRRYRLFDRIVQPLHRLFSWMGIRRESSVALFAGLLFGIAYGGGVMLEEKRSGALTRRDALLVGIFLSLSHALIEDTLLFAAIGANLAVILPVRILFSVLVTLALIGLLPRERPEREAPPVDFN
jgi:hypothetical protein